MNDRNRQIDEAIDCVVRELTVVDPRPGLRQRVLEQLDYARRGWFSIPRPIATGGLTAAAALAVLLLMTPSNPAREDTVTSAPPAAAPAPPVQSGVRARDPQPPSPVVSLPRRDRGPRSEGLVDEPGVIAAVRSAEGAVEIDPLPVIEPIRIAPVRPAAIPQVPEITITSIELEPLEIGPLSSPR